MVERFLIEWFGPHLGLALGLIAFVGLVVFGFFILSWFYDRAKP